MLEKQRMHKFQPLLADLYETARETLGFEPHVKIVIISNSENAENPLGKTAHYSPAEHKIALYTKGRHIKDILRSLSHELVHHNQNCRGDFDGGAATVEGYAQEDGHLREMEREAYERGNMIFRDWEDNLKNKDDKQLFSNAKQRSPLKKESVSVQQGEKMKNQLKESQLRDIIRGVIQEMFNDDLVEGEDLGMDTKAEAETEMAQAGAEDASKGEAPYQAGGEELGESVVGEKVEEELNEDSEAEETEHYGEDEGEDHKKEDSLEDHVDAIEHHLEKIKDDMGYDEEHEDRDEKDTDFHESFFPKDHDIRSQARAELNEALMKRWIKIIK
jgi:hypothetical protein